MIRNKLLRQAARHSGGRPKEQARSGSALSRQRKRISGPDQTECQHVARSPGRNAAMPIRVSGANGRGRQRIGIYPQLVQRRGVPSCAQSAKSRPFLSEPPAPAAQPGHSGARYGRCIIARTRQNRNRHHPRDLAPVAPAMKLRQIVGPHQPDEAKLRVSPLQLRQRIDGKSRAHFGLDRADANRCAARHGPGRRHPRGQSGHAFNRFQHIAGRDQPPHFIEAQCGERMQADPAMRLVRRIETAAKQPDGALCQGRIWPVPRTSHL